MTALVFDYIPADADAAPDLRTADEMELRYCCFPGDILFTVGEVDFSARWGWVPILDFVAGLRRVASALDAGTTEAQLGFTENEEEIYFKRVDSDVQVTATYTPGTAAVSLQALSAGIERFARRVSGDLQSNHPELAKNPAARELLVEIVH
jgi:hypothetical protein